MSTALLLAGWGTSPERLEPLREALSDAGVDARHHVYEPRGSISLLGRRLAAAADRSHDPLHLVGHSLGGLVAAAAVLDGGAEVASVTTVNAPWRGTWAAWTAAPDDPLGRELRWGSDSLAALRDELATHLQEPTGPWWTVLSALGDLAAPATTALRVPGGERLRRGVVSVTGHSVSLSSPRMIDAVRRGVLQPA